MDLLTLLTLAVGLAMDAFAVSICKGLAMREKVLKTVSYTHLTLPTKRIV